MRILVVEDDPDLNRQLVSALTDAGYVVDSAKDAPGLHEATHQLASRWLGDVERRLEGRDWIACAYFTVADIMMAGFLRMVRKTHLMTPFPAVKAYYQRCFGRPAWQRTLNLYAERLGVRIDDIR